MVNPSALGEKSTNKKIKLESYQYKTPAKLSNCKAMLDDNSIIDLTLLDNPTKPRYNIALNSRILIK